MSPGLSPAAAAPQVRVDAIQLATALRLGSELGVFVSYDKRLLAAADAAGLPTARPQEP